MKIPFGRHEALVLIIALTGGMMVYLLGMETPRGQVRGVLLAADTGQPLADVEVALAAAGGEHETVHGQTDGSGTFFFGHVPVGAYRVTTSTQAHEQPGQPIAVREARTTQALFELEPTSPFLRLVVHQQVFTAGERPGLRVHGFAPVTDLRVRVYQLAPEVALRSHGSRISQLVTTHGLPWAQADLDQIPELSRVRAIDLPITKRSSEGVFRQDVQLDRLAPGVYVVVVDAGELRRMEVLSVTDLGLVLKTAPGKALAYVVKLDTGAPVPGAEVTVTLGDESSLHGITDADGLCRLTVPVAREGKRIRAMARAGDSIAIAEAWVSGRGDADSLQIYTYTDRPVYRPGQQVYLKSLLRRLADNEYQVSTTTQARVRVTDERDNLIHAAEYTTNRFGSMNGQFTLAENALPGYYTVSLLTGGQADQASFEVVEYRKPEFEVKVRPERKRVVRGDPIRAQVVAEYYYGAPVPNAEIRYDVYTEPVWSYGEDDEYAGEDESEYDGGYGEYVASGTARTDAGGKVTVVVPTRGGDKDASVASEDQRYVIDVSATDLSRRYASGSGSVLVTPGDFRIEVSMEDWVVSPGDPVEVNIRAIDYNGKPVAGARGEATLARSDWRRGIERLRTESKQSWRADDQGRARFKVTPRKDGDYRVVVRAKDRRRHTITARGWLWVMSGDYASFSFPYQDLDVQADRKSYREGDEAQIVVNTKFAPVTALVTVEGQDILEQRMIRLESKSTVIKTKVRPEFMPAVYLRVCFVKDKRFVSGEAAINVSRERKALQVKITSDKPVYQPGEEAIYRVTATTPDGKPASAEVSLGVVDEAIYAIRPERTPDILRYFYPKRPSAVDTTFSFPAIYLDADNKGGTAIRTRRIFRDTAFWEPAAVTDAAGTATFHFRMPDNLTTWRATCRAATLDTRVGQATQKAIVRKVFSVRLQTPRFLVQSDQALLSGIIHNLTQETVQATAGLEASGLRLDGGERRLSVKPGQTARVEWKASVGQIGTGRVRVWARAGSLSDAMELTLPVLPKGRERIDVYSGSAPPAADFRFQVRQDAVPGTARLTMRLSPSLAGAMLGSLEYLAHFPYGCTEQTMSAFLPDVVIADMLDRVGVPNPGLRARLPKMVEAGLLKLYLYQHDDGGWGWWEYDDSDPWMTAYVVFGLTRAQAAGFTVNQRVLESGHDRLAQLSSNPQRIPPDTLAYIAYVLAVAERGDAGRIIAWLDDRAHASAKAQLSDWGRAMLAATLAELGRGDEARALLAQVWNKFTGPGFSDRPWEARFSGVETAAALLSASCDLMPTDRRLPDLARWMLERRRDNHWDSTRDTAFVLYALTKYLPLTEELQPDLRVTATVNGKAMESRFIAKDVFQPERETTWSKLAAGPAAVKIDVVGKGRLYYTCQLTQVVATDLTTPVAGGSGLVIERSYRRVSSDRAAGAAVDRGRTRYTFRSGDIIEATITVRTQGTFEHLLVEDPLPAGCEAEDRGRMDPWEWEYWWTNQIVRDEKVAFAIRELGPGVHRLRYQMRALTPGTFTALPPQVYDMYRPTIRADGVGATVTIRP